MMKKVIKSILKYKRRVCSLSLFLISIVIVIILSVIFCYNNTTNSPIPELIAWSVEIVTGIFLVVGGIIGIWQYYITTKSEIIKNDTEKVNKAIELAGYFKDNILCKSMFVRYVFNEIGAKDILDKIDRGNMKYFDTVELNNNISSEDISALKEIHKTENFISAVIKANYIFNFNLNYNLFPIDFKSEDDPDKIINNYLLSISNDYLINQLSSVLNNLEYFAMYFKNEVADDIVVYQSLHQTYIEIVELLYYHISVQNEHPSDKYYTNVIYLYNKWKKMNDNQKKKVSEHQEQIRRNQIDREPIENVK